MTGVVSKHLGAALRVLERETPQLHGLVGEQVDARVVYIVTPDEEFSVQLDGSPLAVAGCVAPAPMELAGGEVLARVSPTTLVKLLDGRVKLLDAMMDDRVELWGDRRDFVALERALRTFLQAAVRAPSILDVLKSFRSVVASEHQRNCA